MSKDKEASAWKKFKPSPITRNDAKLGIRKVNKLSKNALRHTRRFVSSRLDRLSLIKRMVIGWVVLILILIGISIVQWASFRSSYVTDAPAKGGTFSEGVIGPLETLNPLFARSSAEKSAAKLMFSSLYTYDKTGNLKGDLAESVSVNSEATEYLVKMRPNTTWSDGVALTANDVVFTVNLLKNPLTRSEISGWQLFAAEAVDSTTVKFMLPGAYAPFLSSLTFPVLPKHVLENVSPADLRDQSFSQNPITSGPFAFRLLQTTSSSSGKKVLHLVANPRYIHGAPLLDRFQINAYNDKQSLANALNSDEIMATPDLVYDDVKEGLKQQYQNEPHTVNNGVFALFNTKDGAASNTSIRQALALSIDRNALRASITQSTARLDGPILSSQASSDLPVFPDQDKAKAIELLEKEGWNVVNGVRQKDGQPLAIRVVTLKGSGFRSATNYLAESWKNDLNIKVDVQVVDPLNPAENVLQSILQPRNYDVLIYELVIGADPDVYAYWHSSQARTNRLNFANYSNTIADDALSGARTKLDNKYRSDRYKSFVRRWMSDVPAIPLYQPEIDYIKSRSVVSLASDVKLVFPEDRYTDVIYWAVSRNSVYRTP